MVVRPSCFHFGSISHSTPPPQRRQKPLQCAAFPAANELPPKRKKPFYMFKEDEQARHLTPKNKNPNP